MDDINRSKKPAALLARTGYTAKSPLVSKYDTVRPTSGPVERPAPLERARGGATKPAPGDNNMAEGRARGGKTASKGGGKTTVNVIIPPGGAGAGPAPMLPHPPMPPPGAMPPHPPMAGPPPGAGMPPGGPPMPPPGMPPRPPGLPPGAGGPGAPLPPGVRPPGLKSGGAIASKMKAGAASGLGRIEKAKAYGKGGRKK